MLTVLIPWRPQPSRLAAFDAVVAWYTDTLGELAGDALGGVSVRTVDSDDEVFNLARCRNLAIESVADPDEVVVISDADTLPEPGPLAEAIDAAAWTGRVHLPYTRYHWLGERGTSQLVRGLAPADCDHELVHGACSGVYVTTPATWWRHGGQDERFRGWGFEDAAWYLAHQTLLGAPPVRHTGTVYALHHVAAQRHGPQYDANEALMAEYRAAAGDPGAMAQVVAAAETAASARRGPGRRRSDSDRVVIDVRGQSSSAATDPASSVTVASFGAAASPNPALSTPAAPAN